MGTKIIFIINIHSHKGICIQTVFQQFSHFLCVTFVEFLGIEFLKLFS